jgi:hypothetical protein
VTKELLGGAEVVRVPADAGPGTTATLEEVGSLSTGFGRPVTAGVVAADGRGVLLRTYDSLLAFDRGPGQDLGAALEDGSPCEAPVADEPQGEAVALRADGGYTTVSEGGDQPVWEVRLRG